MTIFSTELNSVRDQLYNHCDAKRDYAGEKGEYFIWITLEKVEVFSKRDEDLQNLADSFPGG